MARVRMRDGAGAPARLGWLDALKGLAILWIVWNHFAEELFGFPYAGNPGPGWPPLAERWAQLAPRGGVTGLMVDVLRWTGWSGDLGVTLFLVASGLGLAFARARATAPEPWGTFLRRRLLRLFPLWLTAHALVLGPGVIAGTRPLGPVLLSALGVRFLPATYDLGAAAWWYFGLQFQLYLVFPLLWAGLQRLGARRFLAAALGLTLLSRAAGVAWLGSYLDPWLRGAVFVTQLAPFALGMLGGLALARDRARAENWIHGAPVRVYAIAALMLLPLAAVTWAGVVVLPVLAVAALAPLATGLAEALRSTRAGRALGWLGRHSYSVFLVHHVIVLRVAPRGTAPWRTVLAALLVIPAALALERLAGWAERVVVDAVERRRVGALLARVASAALAAALLLAGAEYAVRRLDPQEVLGWGERPALEPHARWGWRLRPSAVTHLRWRGYDYTVRSNALGLPGPDPRPAREPGALRIVTAGDAFTSAEGVDTERAWPRVLERVLAERLHRPVEVIDVAVTGWGPAQYGPALEELIPELRPDAVVIGFFINDPEDAVAGPALEASIGFDRPDPRTLRWRPLHLRAWIANRVVAPLRARLTGRPSEDSLFLSGVAWLGADGARFSPAALDATARWLARIREAARAVGAPVVMEIIPAPAQVCAPADLREFPPGTDLRDASRYDLELPQRRIAALADRVGLEHDDLRSALRATAACPYQQSNLHLTAAGHRAVAERVAERWRDLWSRPEPSPPQPPIAGARRE